MNREELVEAIARAQWDRMEGRNPQPWPWSSADEAERTEYLSVADAAISVALDAILEPIEALHYPANRDFDRTPICADCHGKAGTHPCGCWSEYDRYPICGECGEQEHMPLESDDYPCPTRRACDQIRAEYGGGQ